MASVRKCKGQSRFDTPVGSGKRFPPIYAFSPTHYLFVIVPIHFEYILFSTWTAPLQLSHNQGEYSKREYSFAFPDNPGLQAIGKQIYTLLHEGLSLGYAHKRLIPNAGFPRGRNEQASETTYKPLRELIDGRSIEYPRSA